MNNLYITNKTIILQLFLGMALFSQSLFGITVNNVPLDQIIKPGETIVISPKGKNHFTLFEIKDGNIITKSGDIDIVENLKEVFEELNNKKSGGIKSKNIQLHSNTINYYDSYLVGQEEINIQAKESLNLINCLLESPDISITGNQMNFGDCFLINPQTLCIISNSPESNCIAIHITFNEESTYPTVITGKIDLENNQTPKALLLTNVKKIKIYFSPKVWENQ